MNTEEIAKHRLNLGEADFMGNVHVHCPTLEIVGKAIEPLELPGLETLAAITTPVSFCLALDQSSLNPADREPKIVNEFLPNEWTRLETRADGSSTGESGC